MKKAYLSLLTLFLLTGCLQITAMVGPAMTLLNQGNMRNALGTFVTNKAVEDIFPNGFLVVQDGRNLPSNQNFKIVSMEEVLKKKLSLLGLIN